MRPKSDPLQALGMDLRPLNQLSWEHAAEAFNRCYEGYLLPVRFSTEDLQRRFTAEEVDRGASFVAYSDGAVVAAAALARRPGQARLAAFGITPAFRGRRLGSGLLDLVIESAKARGDRAIELEVFESNAPARRLYQRAGFEVVEELLGFERDATGVTAVALPPPTHAEPLLLARRLAEEAAADLPWQLAPATVKRLTSPWQVVEDGAGTSALVSFARPDAIDLRLVHTVTEARGRGQARALVEAIAGWGGGRPLLVPQLIPARLAPFASALRFRRATLHQLRMRRPLVG